MSLLEELQAAKAAGTSVPESIKSYTLLRLHNAGGMGQLRLTYTEMQLDNRIYSDEVKRWLEAEGLTVTPWVIPNERNEDTYAGWIVTW